MRVVRVCGCRYVQADGVYLFSSTVHFILSAFTHNAAGSEGVIMWKSAVVRDGSRQVFIFWWISRVSPDRK